MNFIKKPNINEAPWKVLFSAIFLSCIGLIALNSISFQSPSLTLSPFIKQLLFLVFFILKFFSSKFC